MTRRDATVEIVVRDTGCGIAADQLSRVFDKYAKANAGSDAMMSAERVYADATGSIGLGLHLCRGLVNAMGGSISLDSEEGVGTRVNITLRVAQGQGAETADDSSFSFTKRPSPVEPAACVPSAKAGIAGGLCLVVDDNSFNRDVMHSMLSVLGHRVLATNGLEALDRIEEAEAEGEPFDLVMMDINMPVLDGLQTTRRLREREIERGRKAPSEQMCVVAVTAYTSADDFKRCLGRDALGISRSP